MTIVTIADLVLYILLAISVGYLFLYAVASLFRHSRPLPITQEQNRFLVLFPAYKADRVIVDVVRSFLEQDYPADSYRVIVISDQMQDDTNQALAKLPIQVLMANYENSSKAKALKLAMENTVDEVYDMVVILDADNTTPPHFLQELNRARATGMKAIQAHRIAKNLNTDIALLDAASEEINNSIFRAGHVVLGLSCALIGSGMAFEADWFRRNVARLHTAGEDKELEVLLLKDRIHINYLEHLCVEDEKTQKKEVIKQQRKRWIATQFGSLSTTLPDLPKALFTGNISYADKIIQWMLPPRLILLMGVMGLTTLTTLVSWPLSIKWWILLLVLMVTMIITIPPHLANKRLLKAICHLPSLAVMMLANMFKLKGVNKKFIHTEN